MPVSGLFELLEIDGGPQPWSCVTMIYNVIYMTYD